MQWHFIFIALTLKIIKYDNGKFLAILLGNTGMHIERTENKNVHVAYGLASKRLSQKRKVCRITLVLYGQVSGYFLVLFATLKKRLSYSDLEQFSTSSI